MEDIRAYLVKFWKDYTKLKNLYIFKCGCSKNCETIKKYKELNWLVTGKNLEISTKNLPNNILFEISLCDYFPKDTLVISFYFNCHCPTDDLLQGIYEAFKTSPKLVFETKIILSKASLLYIYNEIEYNSVRKINELELQFKKNMAESRSNIIINQTSSHSKTGSSVYNYILIKLNREVLIYSMLVKESNNHKIWFIYSKRIDAVFAFNYLNICFRPGLFSYLMQIKDLIQMDKQDLYMFDDIGDRSDDSVVTCHNVQIGYVSPAACIGQMLDIPFNEWPFEKINQYIIEELKYKLGCDFITSPSLAVTFNNTLFNDRHNREASSNDIFALKRLYSIKCVPHIVVQNFDAYQVERMMNFVQQSKCKNLKYLYMTVMSHGGKDNTIYTQNDEYNAERMLLKPLRENKTLKNCQKLVCIVACRGDTDLRFEDEDAIYVERDNSNFDKNIVILHSSHEGFVSYLKEYGSPFIAEFVRFFNVFDYEISIEDMAQGMEESLRSQMTFSPKVTEYSANPAVRHIIRSEFVNTMLHGPLDEGIFELVRNDLFDGIKELSIHNNDVVAVERDPEKKKEEA